MPQGSSSYLIMIVFIVLIGIMMWWQSRKAKQQQQKMKDFRSSLEPGTEVITIGGIIGKVVSVDDQAQVPVDKALESAENATQSDDSAQTADAEK